MADPIPTALQPINLNQPFADVFGVVWTDFQVLQNAIVDQQATVQIEQFDGSVKSNDFTLTKYVEGANSILFRNSRLCDPSEFSILNNTTLHLMTNLAPDESVTLIWMKSNYVSLAIQDLIKDIEKIQSSVHQDLKDLKDYVDSANNLKAYFDSKLGDLSEVSTLGTTVVGCLKSLLAHPTDPLPASLVTAIESIAAMGGPATTEEIIAAMEEILGHFPQESIEEMQEAIVSCAALVTRAEEAAQRAEEAKSEEQFISDYDIATPIGKSGTKVVYRVHKAATDWEEGDTIHTLPTGTTAIRYIGTAKVGSLRLPVNSTISSSTFYLYQDDLDIKVSTSATISDAEIWIDYM